MDEKTQGEFGLRYLRSLRVSQISEIELNRTNLFSGGNEYLLKLAGQKRNLGSFAPVQASFVSQCQILRPQLPNKRDFVILTALMNFEVFARFPGNNQSQV